MGMTYGQKTQSAVGLFILTLLVSCNKEPSPRVQFDTQQLDLHYDQQHQFTLSQGDVEFDSQHFHGVRMIQQ